MQTKTKLKGVKERNYIRHWLGSSILALTVFLFVFALLPTLIAEASATDALAGVRWGSVSLTLDPDVAATEEYKSSSGASGSQIGDTGHGDIDFGEMVPSTKTETNFGTLKVLKKTIGITSTGQYYSVFLSTNGTTNSLNYSGSETATNIPAITSDGTNDGSWDEPAQLKGNGWGFATPGTSVETSTSTSASPTYPSFGLSKSEFSTASISALLDTQITKEAGNTEAKNALYSNTRWSAVPVKSSPQQIWKAEANSINGFGIYKNSNGIEITGDITNNTFDIYYALMVNTNTLAGTYSNQIVYTALASATAIDQVSTNMVISTNIGGQQEPETAWFDLSDSATSITEDDITIALVPHKHLVAANYMELNGQTFTLDKLGHDIDYYATTYGTCAITAGSLTISDGTDGTISHLDCTMPNIPTPQRYRTIIWPEAGGPSTGESNGTFDLWMQIGGYDYNYLTKIEYKANAYIGAFVYAGLDSVWSALSIEVDTNNDGVVDETVLNDPRYTTANHSATSTDNYEKNKIISSMQDVTPRICALTNRWENTTGDDARILQWQKTGYTTSTDINFHAQLGRGTFSLEDERDGKTYLVRRLADGNCWMISNLDLDLTNFAFTQDLTKDNTDLNTEGKSYYDPAASAYLQAQAAVDAEGYSGPALTQSNYFEILSESDGGAIATYQFLPNGINGQRFGSFDLLPRTKTASLDYVAGNGMNGTAYESNGTDQEWNVARANLYRGTTYNWYAATAESQFEINSSALDSLCPKGWQLPKAAGDKSWQNLTSFYPRGDLGLSAYLTLPLSQSLTGITENNGNSAFVNANATYWTNKTSSSTANAQRYLLDVLNGTIYSSYAAARTRALPIRCVARD